MFNVSIPALCPDIRLLGSRSLVVDRPADLQLGNPIFKKCFCNILNNAKKNKNNSEELKNNSCVVIFNLKFYNFLPKLHDIHP